MIINLDLPGGSFLALFLALATHIVGGTELEDSDGVILIVGTEHTVGPTLDAILVR